MTATIRSFGSDAPTSEIAETLRADGGVIIRNLVPEALMDQVYAEINRNTAFPRRDRLDAGLLRTSGTPPRRSAAGAKRARCLLRWGRPATGPLASRSDLTDPATGASSLS